MGRKRGPKWQPKPEDFLRVFQEQNPWHQTGTVPAPWAKDVERPLARHLPGRLKEDEPRRYQLILGPRRVGKTTSMYQVIRTLLNEGVDPKSLWRLQLDHPLLMQIPLDEICRLVVERGSSDPSGPAFLFLDEITYAPKWDLWLKTFYDEHWPLRIIGSSSSTAALRDRRLESGVGRWDEQYLAPYLFPEYLDLIGAPVEIPHGRTLADTIENCTDFRIDTGVISRYRRRFLLTGGFPELLVGMAGRADKRAVPDESTVLLQSQRTLRNDAVERAIYKDIPQAFDIDNPMVLERLLYTLAGQVAGIMSPASICQNLGGLSLPTFSRYLTYLERAFLVFTLPNYSGSEASVQKRGRKLYFVDAAVRNAALSRGLGPLTDLAEMGLLIENMCASHLHALGEQSQVRLYYWRDRNEEIDLIYDHPDAPLAFEVATSGTHHRKGICAFIERFPRFDGRCYLIAENVPLARPSDNWDRIGTIPLDLFLLIVGTQAERDMAARLS